MTIANIDSSYYFSYYLLVRIYIQFFSEKVIKKSKPLPKITEDEIPFDVPSGWAWTRLGDVCETINGKSERTIVNKGNQKCYYIKISDMNKEDNELYMNDLTYCINSDNKYCLPTPTLIFPKVGGALATNKRRIIKQENCIIDSNTMGVFSYLKDIFSYIFIYFKNIDLLEISSGSVLPKVNRQDIDNCLIPLPPLAEQKRIVAKIEELFKLVDEIEAAQYEYNNCAKMLREKVLDTAMRGKLVEQDENDEPASELLAKIKAEKEQLIKDKVIKKSKPLPEITEDEIPFEVPESWEWSRLDNITSLIIDGVHKTPTYVEEGIPFLSVKNISSGKVNFTDTKFITAEAHKKMSERCQPQKNDILYSKVGTTGIPAIVEENKDFNIFVSVALLRFIEPNNLKYLFYALKSPFVYKQSQDGTRGVGNKNLVLKIIKNMILPLPPLVEQKRIVKMINEVNNYLSD